MKIAVWSPTEYAGRKSANLLVFAMQAIARNGGEQLVVHPDVKGSGPEHFLLAGRHRTRMIKQKEFGVELLCKMMHCGRFTKEMAVNAAYSFADGKLHILPPGNPSFYEGNGEGVKELCALIRCAGEVFQHVWIEVPAGENELSRELISASDCVLVSLVQSPHEITKLEKFANLENAFYLVGAYEQRNIFSLNNLCLLYPFLRGKSAVVPYDAGYLAACCTGEAETFLQRGFGTDSVDSFFFHTVEKSYLKWEKGVGGYDTEMDETRAGREPAGL